MRLSFFILLSISSVGVIAPTRRLPQVRSPSYSPRGGHIQSIGVLPVFTQRTFWRHGGPNVLEPESIWLTSADERRSVEGHTFRSSGARAYSGRSSPLAGKSFYSNTGNHQVNSERSRGRLVAL